MQDKIREEILKKLEEKIKVMGKRLLEALMREERKLYLASIRPKLTVTTPSISSSSVTS